MLRTLNANPSGGLPMIRPALVRSKGALLALGFLCLALLVGVPGLRPEPEHRQNREEAATLRWHEERSMLYQSTKSALKVSGSGVQWRHPYARPQPREALKQAPVWLVDYPASV